MVSYKRKRKRNRRTRKGRSKMLVGGNQDKCLFVSLPAGCGLGNQLYVYAAAISVKNKVGLPLCIIPSNNPHSQNDYINILFKQGKAVDASAMKSRVNASKHILEGLKVHDDWSTMRIEANNTTDVTIGSEAQYFQNYNAIKEVIPTIRNDCKEVFEARYPGFKDTIQPSSAFVHVRRGDDYREQALGADYYKRGLAILDGVTEINTIYIISNDIPWCRTQEFSSSKLQWFDKTEDQQDELKTMYLMSLCHAGACISASTFSSWGALLGADQNEASTIVYPIVWVTGDSSQNNFPARWKAI